MTNEEYARANAVFRKACELAGIAQTTMEARLFRRCWGAAFQKKAQALEIVNRNSNRILGIGPAVCRRTTARRL